MPPSKSRLHSTTSQRSATSPGSRLQAHSQGSSEQSVQRNSSTRAEFTSGDMNNQSGARKGRGPAKGIKKWGKSGYKMHLHFNENMQVCGKNSKAFATKLGMIAKCGVKAPLKPYDWRKVSKRKKAAIWKEIQDNTDAPEEYKKLCLMRVGDMWRSWKSKVKKNFYTPNKNNPAALAIPPADSRVKPSSWIKLVEHWQKEDVQKQAEKNQENRKQSEFPHRTGRTSFADIRLEMMEKGEDISRPNVFRRTRMKKNAGHTEEVNAVLEQMNKKLSAISESDRTPELVDGVFTEVMGADGHGRVRTFSMGVTPTTFGSNSSSSSASSDRIQKIIDMRVDMKVDAKIKEIERNNEEIIASKIRELERNQQDEIAAAVQRQLQAYGIFQPSDNRMSGSARVRQDSMTSSSSDESDDGSDESDNGNYESDDESF